MRSVYALIPAALLAGTVLAAPAHASNKEDPGTHSERVSAQKKHFKKTAGVKKSGQTRKVASVKKRKLAKTKLAKTKLAKAKTRKFAAAKTLKTSNKPKFAATSLTKTVKVKAPEQQAALTFTKMTMSDQSLAINGAGDERVAAIIREMAPSYGVPTWFALRIANVESGFNPYARGRAGEIGVYQLKCQTARGMGFEGNCSALTDARTNVRWGLKHLSLAITSSGGNLKLAASKHNAGLGRKSLVHSYIAKVF
jgi:soluble lytic murein transglycosylase-like protein